MKNLRKIVIAVLLLSYALSLSPAVAVDYSSVHDKEELDATDEHYAVEVAVETEGHYSLPHRDVFINSFPSFENSVSEILSFWALR